MKKEYKVHRITIPHDCMEYSGIVIDLFKLKVNEATLELTFSYNIVSFPIGKTLKDYNKKDLKKVIQQVVLHLIESAATQINKEQNNV